MTLVRIDLKAGAQQAPEFSAVRFSATWTRDSGSTRTLAIPSVVNLDANGQGSVSVDPGVWMVDMIVPLGTETIYVLVPDLPEVNLVDCQQLREADAGFAPAYAEAADRAMAMAGGLLQQMRDLLATVPDEMVKLQAVATDAQEINDQTRAIASNIRGRVERGPSTGPDAHFARVVYPYDETAPTPGAPDVGGAGDWNTLDNKPTTFRPTIGDRSIDAVAGNDSRLTDARRPTAHDHAIGDVDGLGDALDSKADKSALADKADTSALEGKADTADLEALAGVVDEKVDKSDLAFDFDAKANAVDADLTGSPTADSPGANPDGRAIATVSWVRANFSVDGNGTVTEIPKATSSTHGTVMLSGVNPGELGGTADRPVVMGWGDKLDASDLVDYVTQTQAQEALAEYQLRSQYGFAPLNAEGIIDARFLPAGGVTPGAPSGGLGDIGALRPESYSGTTEEKIEAAAQAAHTQNKSLYLSGTYTITRTVNLSGLNVHVWGPFRILVSASSTMGYAFTAFGTTQDHFAVREVRQNTFGWSGASKPSNPDVFRGSEVVPMSPSDLSKIISEDSWRLENKWSGDKYGWSEEVGATVLKGSHFPVMGVLFSINMVSGKSLREGDAITQKNDAGTVVATGVLKGFQRTESVNGVSRPDQFLLESMTGTFSASTSTNPGTILKDGVAVGTLVASKGEPGTGYAAVGTVLMRGIPLDDSFTPDPAGMAKSTPVSSIVMRRLPRLRFTWIGGEFDTIGNPEDNTPRRDRVGMMAIGNLPAPRVETTFRRLWSTGLRISGTPNYTIRLQIYDAPNDARFMSEVSKDSSGNTIPNPNYDESQDIAAYGYGLEKYGACDNGYAYIRGGRGRHLYTNNPDQRSTHPLDVSNASASSLSATGTSRDCVTEMFAYDCFGQAFDLHEGTYREVLQNFYIAGSGIAGGMKDSGKKSVGTRGFSTIIRNGIIRGGLNGVTISSIHIAGCPFLNHPRIENVDIEGYQDTGINTGNLPAESSNHKVSVIGNRLKDSGYPKSKPWDSIGISLSAVDTDVFDNVIDGFNRSPMLLNQKPTSGVLPEIRIGGNTFEYLNVKNSSSSKANGCEFFSTDGFTFKILPTNIVSPKDTGTSRQPQTMFINQSGSGKYRWPKDSSLISMGEAVTAFASNAGAPKHSYLSASAFPVPN